jgi:hypothetical protein
MSQFVLLMCFLFSVLALGNCQWILQDSHTTASLRGIHSIGNGVAWASGTEGTILRTTDEGSTWQRCDTPPDAERLDFRGIQAFDQNTAIVMSSGKGDLSRLYKTTDACKSWKLVFTNPDKDGFWDAMQFRFDPVVNPTPNYGQGVLVGDPVDGKFIIYVTHDKGDTWVPWVNDAHNMPYKDSFPAKARKGESLFAASNSALVTPGASPRFAFVTGGAGGARLFLPEPHSPLDNGTTWKFTVTDLPFIANETAGAFSIASRPNAKIGADLMIVGGDYRTPDASGTAAYLPFRNDCCFGLLPQKIVNSTHPPHGYRSSVAYDSTTKTWITVGPNGTDISRDDGKNWTALKPTAQDAPDADKNWNALSLPFVVGPHGRIGKLNAKTLAP